MFFKKKNNKFKEYDKENEIPIIHASICTGEKVVGFKNKNTGKFVEIMLINDNSDLEKFKKEYAINDDIKTEY